MISVFICHNLYHILNSLFVGQSVMLFKIDNKKLQIHIRKALTLPIPAQIPCNVNFVRKHIQPECTFQIRVMHQNQTIITDCFPDFSLFCALQYRPDFFDTLQFFVQSTSPPFQCQKQQKLCQGYPFQEEYQADIPLY